MGLRQSKRSVDISGSPKKDAGISEKQVNDVVIPSENVGEELNKSTKEEVTQNETKDVPPQEDGADVKSEPNKESKQEESVAQTEEKKEKVKKKRSFRSFSFLRREKKAKEENKNGDIVKEAKIEATEVQPVETETTTTAQEEDPVKTEGASAEAQNVAEDVTKEETKENETAVATPSVDEVAPPVVEIEQKSEENKSDAVTETLASNEPVSEPAPEAAPEPESPAAPQEESEVEAEEQVAEEIVAPQVDQPLEDDQKKAVLSSEESQLVSASEE